MESLKIIITNESQIDKVFTLLKKGKWLDETSMFYNPDIKGFQTTDSEAFRNAVFYLNTMGIKTSEI